MDGSCWLGDFVCGCLPTVSVYQVSWLRLRDPIPQLMSLNNVTNTLNTRFRALVTDWREFVLMVRDVRTEDAGLYECQVLYYKIPKMHRG